MEVGKWRLLLLQTVLLAGVVSLLRPATSYRALELGISTAWLGMISASFALIPLAVALPVGRFTDRIGQRLPLQAGAMLIAAAACGFAVAGTSLVALLALSALLGLGHLLAVVATQSLVADVWPPERHDVAFGTHAFAVSAGQLLGPGVVAALGGTSTHPDPAPMFVAAAAMGVCVIATSLVLRVPSQGRIVEDGQPAGLGAAFRVPGLVPAVFASLTVPVTIDLLAVYLPALGQERSISARGIGLLLAVRAAASMVSRILLGPTVRRLGRRRLLFVGMAGAAVSVALIPVPMPAPLLAVVLAMLGFGLGVSQPLTLSWLAGAAPRHVRATAMAVRLSGNRLGQVLAPAAIGLVASAAGTAGVLWATASVLSLAVLASTRVP